MSLRRFSSRARASPCAGWSRTRQRDERLPWSTHQGVSRAYCKELSRPLGTRTFASAGGSATFADARQMRREYGVSPVESARRGSLIDAGDERRRAGDERAYRPAGGLAQVGASATLAYVLTPRWSLMGLAQLAWLAHEAAGSPLVRRREQLSGVVD